MTKHEEEGYNAALREIEEENWTVEMGHNYLKAVGPLSADGVFEEFDAGHRLAVFDFISHNQPKQ